MWMFTAETNSLKTQHGAISFCNNNAIATHQNQSNSKKSRKHIFKWVTVVNCFLPTVKFSWRWRELREGPLAWVKTKPPSPLRTDTSHYSEEAQQHSRKQSREQRRWEIYNRRPLFIRGKREKTLIPDNSRHWSLTRKREFCKNTKSWLFTQIKSYRWTTHPKSHFSHQP